ncbi:MAG: enoyl-CoA hydratase/isomerase family protein [Rubrivivax sp.]
MADVDYEIRGRAGLITLNRPKALNALSLGMVRTLTQVLLEWSEHSGIDLVAIRGMGKDPSAPSGSAPFGAFCAGGDIRFFHQAALAGDPALEDFFTEEYALNHLVHRFPKPYLVFMDGIVMGGGMGIAGHGAAHSLRIATERTKMAMPETAIGLFPDVGGGWFLARCPGRIGEYLALTGQVIDSAAALNAGLADGVVTSADLPGLWDALAIQGTRGLANLRTRAAATPDTQLTPHREAIDHFFGLPDVPSIVQALESATGDWAHETATVLRKRSPLMLHVVLQQVRRARDMILADDLRLERGMVRHCFHLRPGTASETVEGIRALAVDKDHAPRWNPARIEDVTPAMVQAFFESPWPVHAHPLRALDEES